MYQQTVDYGTKLIIDFLNLLTGITHSHGWSILLLTLVFRILILPLTMKSIKSMKTMQLLQPKMKEIQEKYKDDKERQTKEMMALYKEAGANPFSGCLPMLLPIPIFILLFRVLRYPEFNDYMLINSSFYGMDLTTAAITQLPHHLLGGLSLTLPGMIDLSFTNLGFLQNTYFYLPTTILVVLMTVSTFLQQASMTMDPKQKPTMYMMNIFLVYISLTMPSGVLLYWVFSNILQLIQQKFTGTAPAAAKDIAEIAEKRKHPHAAPALALAGETKSKPAVKPVSVPKTGNQQARKPAANTGSLKKDSAPKKPQSASSIKKKKKKK